MPTPAILNITIYQGDTYEQTFRFRLSDGTYMNLAGYTGSAEIRRVPSEDIVLATFTVTMLEDNESLQISLTPEETAALTVGRRPYSWDLQLVDSEGFVTTYLAGSVRILEEVTR